MSFADLIFARSLLALVVFEWFADGQMWDYQTAKHAYLKSGKYEAKTAKYTRAQFDRGFITTGLWKYSRHPNFAAEQLIWVLVYAWGCHATGSLYNWTASGMISYLLIFVGSTPLTERITAGKYPEYKIYQQRVGKLLPNIFGKGWSEKEMETLGPKVVAEAEKKKELKRK